MKSQLYAILLVLLFAVAINAQEPQPVTAAESVENLRAQLFDVQTRENDLRARAEQLDEALKPENIERSLAGVGSTRPEELRESRRKQLQIERDGITRQLNTLETSRMRLEAALRDAEARAYHESAQGVPTMQMMAARPMWGRRLLYPGSAAGLAAGLILSFVVRRRLRKKRSEK